MKRAALAMGLTLSALSHCGSGKAAGDSTEYEFQLYVLIQLAVANYNPCPTQTLLTVGVSFGPYDRDAHSGCFSVTTAGPKTVFVTTSGTSPASIRFLASSFVDIISVDDPTASIPSAGYVIIRVTSVSGTQLTVLVN